MFNLPADFVSESLVKTKEFFSDTSPMIFLIVGILIAGLVIEIILDIADSRRYNEEQRRWEDYSRAHRGGLGPGP
jgi:hypothetical protein